MNAWRVARATFCRTAAEAFDGTGAAEGGGRWNGRGVRTAYASTTLSLAILEYLANLADRTLAPRDLIAIRAAIPDDAVFDATKVIPADWRTVPAPATTRDFGDGWVEEGRWLAALVPSVVLPDPTWAQERNVLINPSHRGFGDLVYDGPRPITVDERLF